MTRPCSHEDYGEVLPKVQRHAAVDVDAIHLRSLVRSLSERLKEQPTMAPSMNMLPAYLQEV